VLWNAKTTPFCRALSCSALPPPKSPRTLPEGTLPAERRRRHKVVYLSSEDKPARSPASGGKPHAVSNASLPTKLRYFPLERRPAAGRLRSKLAVLLRTLKCPGCNRRVRRRSVRVTHSLAVEVVNACVQRLLDAGTAGVEAEAATTTGEHVAMLPVSPHDFSAYPAHLLYSVRAAFHSNAERCAPACSAG
jgi:hypothetical protein